MSVFFSFSPSDWKRFSASGKFIIIEMSQSYKIVLISDNNSLIFFIRITKFFLLPIFSFALYDGIAGHYLFYIDKQLPHHSIETKKSELSF